MAGEAYRVVVFKLYFYLFKFDLDVAELALHDTGKVETDSLIFTGDEGFGRRSQLWLGNL